MCVAYKYCFAESLRIIDWFASGYRQLFNEMFVIQANDKHVFQFKSSVAISQFVFHPLTVFDTKPAENILLAKHFNNTRPIFFFL